MAPMKIDTKSQVSRILSAFGDSGDTGANPPFPANAAGVSTATNSRALVVARSARTGCHSMNVPESASRGTRVRLPPDVARPFEIYVNGVPQEEGRDFAIEGRTLVFERELKSEGKLGFWRWLSMWVGVAGTYRQNDSVDVVYQRNGKRVVATKLPLEPLGS